MSTPAQPEDSAFDAYAVDYDVALEQGLSVSGESKDFFAQKRMAWLAECLAKLSNRPESLMDYGCGTGSSIPFLLSLGEKCCVTGVDISARSLQIARTRHGSARAQFVLARDYQPAGRIDLAFCNGVFHHIPLERRTGAVEFVFQSLHPGGLFAFWENNPWNPGTRYVMRRIPFDRDAVTLSCIEARRLLTGCGFKVLRTDFLFYFPRSLSWFRWMEMFLTGVPFGAQYLVLCRKP